MGLQYNKKNARRITAIGTRKQQPGSLTADVLHVTVIAALVYWALLDQLPDHLIEHAIA
jgi:hypothetical protein